MLLLQKVDFQDTIRYGRCTEKTMLRVSKSIIPEIDKVVKYVNELEVKIPNRGLEFIKNNL